MLDTSADLISLPEIADLAGVRRPVVTTWRRRYPAFPQPCQVDRTRPLFKAREVVDWLVETGRAERSAIEPDLRLHLLAGLAVHTAMRQTAGRRQQLTPESLVAAVTALICLHHLDEEPLCPEGYTSRQVVDELRDRATEADWDDEFLRSEIDVLPSDAAWLARAVDELIEAAWGTAQAYERILAARQRWGVPQLYKESIVPELARLLVGLAGARERADARGFLQVAVAHAGVGDLLATVRRELGDHDDVVLFAAEADPFLARLARRRLIVHGVSRSSWQLDVASDLPPAAGVADVLLMPMLYQPAEARGDVDPFAEIAEAAKALTIGRTAVVLGPADLLVGALAPYRAASRSRNALLATGRVEAIVQLPGGMMPFRPGYQTGLWVLRHEEDSDWRGRILLADVSDAPLTDRVVEDLIVDVATWRREGHHPDEHLRAYGSQVLVEELVTPRRPLTARRPATLTEAARDGQLTIAELTETEVALDRLAEPRPRLRSRLAARDGIRRAPTKSVGALVRDGHLVVLRGSRIAAGHVGAGGHNVVIGPAEVTGDGPVGFRRIDRAVFAERYPRARLSEPGDVLVTMTPRLRAYHDEQGYSVVEYPTRILRIRPDGRNRLTPRVLEALLNAVPVTRATGAVRAVARLTDLQLPLLPPTDVARLDALLGALAERRNLARRELDLLDDLGRRAVDGLTDGVLAIAEGPPLTGPPRPDQQD